MNTNSKKAILLNKKDNVVTILSPICKGESIEIVYNGEVVNKLIVLDDVEVYHKIALVPIEAGEHIYKYGEVIGKATQFIKVGQHVHIHNIESARRNR